MMDKIYDLAFGWVGLVCLCIAILVGAAASIQPAPSYGTKAECEDAGGQWVQTMKTYHTCKFSKAS